MSQFKNITYRVVSLTSCPRPTISDHIRVSSKKGNTYNLCQTVDWTGDRDDHKRATNFSQSSCVDTSRRISFRLGGLIKMYTHKSEFFCRFRFLHYWFFKLPTQGKDL